MTLAIPTPRRRPRKPRTSNRRRSNRPSIATRRRSSSNKPRTPRRRRSTWGGARPGAGRKKSYDKERQPPHTKRPVHTRLTVFHVTMKVLSGLPYLRSRRIVAAIRAIFADAVAAGRLAPAHWSIQTNHLHLIIEASSSAALSLGMQSIGVRVAKTLNRIWRRKGQVFRARYFARAITGPGEIRNVIRYVLLNHKRHGARVDAIDPASSGAWFHGWAHRPAPPPGPRPVAAPRSDFLTEYWYLHGGPLYLSEQPIGRMRCDEDAC